MQLLKKSNYVNFHMIIYYNTLISIGRSISMTTLSKCDFFSKSIVCAEMCTKPILCVLNLPNYPKNKN